MCEKLEWDLIREWFDLDDTRSDSFLEPSEVLPEMVRLEDLRRQVRDERQKLSDLKQQADTARADIEEAWRIQAAIRALKKEEEEARSKVAQTDRSLASLIRQKAVVRQEVEILRTRKRNLKKQLKELELELLSIQEAIDDIPRHPVLLNRRAKNPQFQLGMRATEFRMKQLGRKLGDEEDSEGTLET